MILTGGIERMKSMSNEEHSIGRWISILYRYRQSYINRKLESYDIASSQYIILLTLYKIGAKRQEELSDYLKIDKGCIAKSIKKLEEEGYVERIVDTEDKRAYKLLLTQKALDFMPVILDIVGSWEDIATSFLTEDEIKMVDKLLQKMAQKVFDIKTK